MQEAYIVSTARTPIGRFGGGLKEFSPSDLGAHVMKAILQRANIPGDALDMYIFGNVLRAGHGQLIPRQAAVKAGIPQTIDGYAVDMVCSSGMMSVMNATMMIKSGEADLVLAGGMESMSQAGFFLSHRARWGYKFLLGKPEQLKDVLEYDGLTDPIEDEGMGSETERLAAEYGITREEVDEVAYYSHKRAAEATAQGIFKTEIAPVEVKTRKGTTLLDEDEGIRPDTTPESLAKLRPAFTSDGILTAGNASQISDGAAALLIANDAAIKRYDLTPIARIIGGSWAAVDSWRFAEAPIPAVRKLAAKHKLDVADFDLVENNEAFAVNTILMNRELGVPTEKLNIYGSGISLGHPIGCTGARLIVTLLTGLQNEQGKLGLASLCHGMGGGTAVAVERL
ncbi:3-ketoacyl-CoA thiolase @ Acetyl-CoA acetyltransferase [hydrothermal vent metagenome]|uniref:3-ketoacyl-CoA thiolase @ Acetyl-CoA acetyltransferase n=1 Tax=hydrothermal vent metagenome TaxID=652676 RepID=A0A3B0V1P9_9ZZZZ